MKLPSYCSRSVGMHLLRGVVALALVGVGVSLVSAATGAWTLLSLLCFAGAFYFFRGCPMCWLMDLFKTTDREKARSPS